MAVSTIVPGVPAISINSDIAGATAGTAFALPNRTVDCAFQLVYTGSPSAVSVSLQISMDNVTWATIATSTDTAGIYTIIEAIVAKYIRLYHTSRTGGTNVAGTLLIT